MVGQDYGFPTKITMRDYRFAKSAVNFGNGVVDPQEGDRITEGSDVYEVMPLDGVPAVELQAGDFEWIVHTKQVT